MITNYPEGQVEELETVNNPEMSCGSHIIEFSRELWIEREDFMEDAPKKILPPDSGNEVRLKSAYIVKVYRMQERRKRQRDGGLL